MLSIPRAVALFLWTLHLIRILIKRNMQRTILTTEKLLAKESDAIGGPKIPICQADLLVAANLTRAFFCTSTPHEVTPRPTVTMISTKLRERHTK